jgi:hypothetical protein
MPDLSHPAVQGALIAFTGVVVAAVAGYFGALTGARIGAAAARETAKVTQAESQAARQEARESELRRHDWEVEQWHRAKSASRLRRLVDLLGLC